MTSSYLGHVSRAPKPPPSFPIEPLSRRSTAMHRCILPRCVCFMTLLGLLLGTLGVGIPWVVAESRRTTCDMTNFRFYLLTDNRTSVLNRHAMVTHQGLLYKTLKTVLIPEEAACVKNLPLHPFFEREDSRRVLQQYQYDDFEVDKLATELIDSALTPNARVIYHP